MKPRPRIEVPPDVMEKFRRADRIEWISLVLMFLCVVLVYFTVSQSQAMHAIFIEDILALIPPIVYLCASRIRFRPPNERFPYGYHHSITIGFLCSAVALLGLGSMVLIESVKTLIAAEHPSVGVLSLFGHQVWIGWLTYPVLLITVTCEHTVGKIKHPVALELHDKALAADARMNRADSLTGASAMLGMTGIAFGWWWADGVAATIIAIEILRDGWDNLTEAVTDLMDEVPTKADGEGVADWEEKLRGRLRSVPWIRESDVRLREEGNILSGEVFAVLASDGDLPRHYADLQKIAREVDWRFYDLALVPVERL